MTDHVYIAEQKKGFNFVVILDDKRERVRFIDGQFITKNDDLAKAIDALRKVNPGIARRCHKSDREAAEKLALAHRQLLARTGAVKGGVTAEAARHAMDTSLAERDLKLRSQNVDVDAFAEENLQMTEKAEPPVEKTDDKVVEKDKVEVPKKEVASKVDKPVAKTTAKPKTVLKPKTATA